eukprot:TRINITY_DN6010_c0_g1_i1.p1 TRINITY_DN6010_c0_g1~~TRINITY_DN6010_c0_g1_i1.p1  ORF type:complete len:570 (+),score=121.49 TRINITY_DN6010_c0_g1_i1:347-2056(+)
MLLSLAGMPKLTHLGGLTIGSNILLENLHGLNNITRIEGSMIIENSTLVSLEGLDQLTFIGGSLVIQNNPNLLNISQLKNLEYVGDTVYFNNNNLGYLEMVFENLYHIGSNLTFLNGQICQEYGDSSFPALENYEHIAFFDDNCCYYWEPFLEIYDGLCVMDDIVCDNCTEGHTCYKEGTENICFPGVCEGNYHNRHCISCLDNFRYGSSCDLCDCSNSSCDSNVTGGGSCICDTNYYGTDCSQKCDCDETEWCFDGVSGNGTCYSIDVKTITGSLSIEKTSSSVYVSENSSGDIDEEVKDSENTYEDTTESSIYESEISSGDIEEEIKDILGDGSDIYLNGSTYNNVKLNDSIIHIVAVQVSIVNLNANNSEIYLGESKIVVEGSFSADSSNVELKGSNLNIKGDLAISDSVISIKSGSTIKVDGCLIVQVGTTFVIDAIEEGEVIEYGCLVGDEANINVEFVNNDGECYESRVRDGSLSVIFVCGHSNWWVILVVAVTIVFLILMFVVVYVKFQRRSLESAALIKGKRKEHENRQVVMQSMTKLQSEIKIVEDQVADLEVLVDDNIA